MTAEYHTNVRVLADQVRPQHCAIFIADHVGRIALIDGRSTEIKITVRDKR